MTAYVIPARMSGVRRRALVFVAVVLALWLAFAVRPRPVVVIRQPTQQVTTSTFST